MLFIALIGVSLLKLKCWNLIRSGLFSIFQITLSFSPLHSAHSLDKIEPIDNEHHVNSELFTILRSSLIWGLIATPCTIKCCSWPKKQWMSCQTRFLIAKMIFLQKLSIYFKKLLNLFIIILINELTLSWKKIGIVCVTV